MALLIITHLPPGESSERLPKIDDKFVHFISYAILTVLVSWRWAPSDPALWPKWRNWAFWGLGLHGILDEVSQIMVCRTCDPLDWLADMAGVGLVLWWMDRQYKVASDNDAAHSSD